MLRLEQSRCFWVSGSLSCRTCHVSHEPLRRADADYYNAKCLNCHAQGLLRPSVKSCLAVVRPDCTGCHMPPVTVDTQLTFRNHWIGVYRSGAVLMPVK